MERKSNVMLLKNFFKKYYTRQIQNIFEPNNFTKREFAFIMFDKDGMIRHISFENLAELRRFIMKNIPRHVYYSSAYYENPSSPTMEDKIWLGADLVFDIDVDHIETPCKKEHDKWLCLECGYNGKGMAPEECPKCGSKKIEKETWVCDICIETAKEEALKLIDILIDELGFSEKSIYAVFSGHRGFHIHVEDDRVKDLDQDARREIVDYVLGVGLDYTLLCTSSRFLVLDIDLREKGWRGRIARGLYETILESDEDLLSKIGIKRKEIKRLLQDKDKILREIEKEPSSWFLLTQILSKKSLELLINYVIDKYKCKIDERVTIDIKRLIRLPGTLHGKTGFKVMKLDISEIEAFDISQAFTTGMSDEVILEVEELPKKIANYKFSNTKGRITVPLPIALYIIGNSSKPVKLVKVK